MIVIPIKSKIHGLKHFFIDGEDFDLIKDYTWHITKNNYVQTNIKSNKSEKRYVHYGIHRLIMNCPDGMVVDHINHNALDNRKENLRICTESENNRNRRKINMEKFSIYKGVYWQNRRKKYRSSIMCNGKFIHIGCFNTEEEAALAYNIKASELFGKYALLNIVG